MGERDLQLPQTVSGLVVTNESGGALQLRNDRIERAVLVMRRTVILKPSMRFVSDALAQRVGKSRFAYASLR